MNRFLPLGIFLVIAVFLGAGLYMDPRKVPSPLINKPAPEFTLPELAKPGQKFSRDDMNGKVWLLNVWASWCVACREEHPVLVQFSHTKIVPIIGLNYKDKRRDGLRWLAEFGDPYQVVAFDHEGQVGINFGVYGVPETFLIDKKGIIRYKQIGAVTPEVLRDKIIPLVHKLNGDA